MKNIVIKVKKEMVEVKCQGCGKKMTIQTPYKGDVLCGECMEPVSYTLKVD